MDEREERRISDHYETQLREKTLQLIDGFKGDVKEYLTKLHSTTYHADLNVDGTNFGKRLRKYLADEGAKPSDFFKEEISNMKGYIADELLDDFYASIDRLPEWQISVSEYRRSFRSKDYRYYTARIADIVWNYHKLSQIGAPITDIITGNIAGELGFYCKYSYQFTGGVPEEIIAIRLDAGDAELEKVLTDMIYDNAGKLGINMIRGIMMSHHSKMYEALGKLLLAARLSEGLRQAICENMDVGTKEAFLYLFNIIMENDLIRFSSVMRAAGTWTGLLTIESKDLDRISKKQIGNISVYLKDEEARKSALESEDSMDIYLALWSYAFEEFKAGLKMAASLALTGTKHQRLTACYFIRYSDIPSGVHAAAAQIIEKYYDDSETMAIIFTGFMNSVDTTISNLVADIRGRWNDKPDATKIYKRVYAESDSYFGDEVTCRKYYEIMLDMLKLVPKKSIDFEKLVFNWNKETLKKSDIVVRLAFCASALKDESLIDEVTGYLDMVGESYSSIRANVLALLCTAPVTKQQKNCLITAVSNPESYTRELAIKLVKQLALDAEDYLKLEDMLRLKKSDVRESVIGLMENRPVSDKLPMVQRLLADKKEEKRTAGLDILKTMKAKSEISEKEAKDLVSCIAEPTTKEQILIQEICKSETKTDTAENGYGLYDDSADYEPVLEGEYLEECKKVLYQCFPHSTAFGSMVTAAKAKDGISAQNSDTANDNNNLFSNIGRELALVKKLDEIIEANKFREYTNFIGNTELLGNNITDVKDANGNYVLPFSELWENFLKENHCTAPDLLRMHLLPYATRNDDYGYSEFFRPLMTELLGDEFNEAPVLIHASKVSVIVSRLFDEYGNTELFEKLAVAIAYYLIHYKKDLVYSYETESWNHVKSIQSRTIATHDKLKRILIYLNVYQRDFPFKYALAKHMDFDYECGRSYALTVSIPDTCDYIAAYVNGFISKDFMYKMIMNLEHSLKDLSLLIRYIRESDRKTATNREGSRVNRATSNLVERLLGHKLSNNESSASETSVIMMTQKEDNSQLHDTLSETETSLDNEADKAASSPAATKDSRLLAIAGECYEKISSLILDTELVRGDTETIFSKRIFGLKRIYGVRYFVRIISALGNEKLIRSSYFNSYYKSSSVSKPESLSHLLSSCIPDIRDGETPKQQAELLKTLLKETDITDERLIEAAMYSPEWIEIVGEYLGWEGFMSCCYYFMAHMNESFDDKRKAMIAKFTPLTPEELNDGAFDLDWFSEVYHALGKQHFDKIYKAAKYISDGSKHSRARKYADAATGKLDTKKVEAEITAKRNKDLLMAYGIIPVASASMYKEKYLFLQQFLKESRQFGAQRRASEKTATEMSLKNLAIAAGYTDETRFILRMEGEIASELIGYFTPTLIEDVTISLKAGEAGKVEIVCEKAGKTLKSVPAKLKKNEYVMALQDAKKTLTAQYKRTKKMFEESMEQEDVFTVKELLEMRKSPAVSGLIDSLIFKSDEKFGFLNEFYSDTNDETPNLETSNSETSDSKTSDLETSDLETSDLKTSDLKSNSDTRLVIAHPYHLYKAGVWHQYQQIIFEQQIKQPFKQVFRELYIKTGEEKEAYHSMRYAGNQIQPAKTVACLKDRRWIADVEDGLQKVYYKENIIACIYALADWFSPADIEAPTLEWVVFYDRKTYKEIKIDGIPDILFSEVMRDVDLAVSVAHAGGVDPEMSHSTVEMRRAIAEFTMPLFKLKNVTFTETHAVIEGKRASYTVHLGNGVIHKMGGPMINVLPVHSQHKGRIFLPFVDDDPKTAEIITKIVMFAEDDKIQDPFILEQI